MSWYRNRNPYAIERHPTEKQIKKGSIAAVAKKTGRNIVDIAALEAEALILVDTSSSMTHILMSGESAHDRAESELAKLQREFSGKVAVFSFSTEIMWCPTGTPHRFNGGTAMAAALDYIHKFDGLMKIYLLSDGYPTHSIGYDISDVEEQVLRVADKFKSPINTIFIGDELDHGAQEFLRRLAERTGGQHMKTKEIAQLYDPASQMMLADGIQKESA